MNCPSCRTAVPPGARFCASCGAQVQTSEAETALGSSSGATRPASSPNPSSHPKTTTSGWLTSSGSIDHGRFTPGVVVEERYRIIGLLDAKTLKAERGERVDKHLLITRYDQPRAARGEMLTIDDVLEILSTPLLGIIPESEEVLRASNLGSPITLNNPNSGAARAYFDAARRLMGEDIAMTVPVEKVGLFGKLFGRRAA